MMKTRITRALGVLRPDRLLAGTASGHVRKFSTSVAALKPAGKQDMFCFQCEQTNTGTGCTTIGVCGKTPEVAALQDLLIYACQGLSNYAHRMRVLGHVDQEIDTFVKEALFATLTNVDFDAKRFVHFLKKADSLKVKAKSLYESALKGQPAEKIESPSATWKINPNATEKELVMQANSVGVQEIRQGMGPDVGGVHELVMYGLKGMCAYADHAHVLEVEDPEVDGFVHEVLDYLSKPAPQLDTLLGYAMKVGEMNIRVMANLDHAGTSRYGHPEPTRVRTTGIAGKCILVSGHDLRDVEYILQQTEGKGINVFTHGELLPAHGYPGLKKYKHLVGNYGGAWQEQKLDFSTFPGSIVVTTNCIIEPKKSYKGRIFTRSVVGFPGVTHLEGNDFTKAIDAAIAAPGFAKDEVAKYTMTGFGRNAVLAHSAKIVELVKAGKLKHFFLIGGCDGAEGERSYFRDLALATPKDTVVLTLACGKYRFNKRFDEFGDIEGIPRMLDLGQCNDSYSAIQIAVALSKAFNTDVNGLPLSFAISWFEQKAVAVLLSLLHLNIQNIYLGPKLPAFITPTVLGVLQQKFKLHPIGNPIEDLKTMLAK